MARRVIHTRASSRSPATRTFRGRTTAASSSARSPGSPDGDAPVEIDADSPLTARETEVLRLVATGMSNREIASTLVLSEHTVHRHVANILRKLAQSTRVAAATHATRVGLI